MVDGQELEFRGVVLERMQTKIEFERFCKRTGHVWESSLVGHKWQRSGRIWHQLAVQIITSKSNTWNVDIWQIKCVNSSVFPYFGLIKTVIRVQKSNFYVRVLIFISLSYLSFVQKKLFDKNNSITTQWHLHIIPKVTGENSWNCQTG